MKIHVSIVALSLLFLSCDQKKKEDAEPEASKIAANSADINHAALVGNDFLIDDLHSYVGFKIKYFGYSPVRGRFDTFDGTIFHDPEHMEAFSVTTIIDIGSINTGNERRDNDLKKEGGWFDVPQFPLAYFTSTGVTPHDNGFHLDGNLTIKGNTKPIQINFEQPLDLSKDSFKNDQFSLYGTFTISREDFGVIGGDFWTTVMENGLTQLSDEVEMEIELHCRRTDYTERYLELDSTDVRKTVLHKIRDHGMQQGLTAIDSLRALEKVSSGALSTVGYILLDWDKKEEALQVFSKKRDLFGNSAVIQNQIGVVHYHLGEKDNAMDAFQAAKKMDSTNSRSVEYIKLMEAIQKEP